MKYSEIIDNIDFHKNMQETNWLKLFPKWWSENDPLLKIIGDEIELMKAQAIFELLNTVLKPPVMIWQESIDHKEYKESFSIVDEKNESIKLPGPQYKTYGKIKIKNNTIDDISDLKIYLNETDYIVILDTITTDDEILINVGNSEKVYINNEEANIKKYGKGLSYFSTVANLKKIDPTVTKTNKDGHTVIFEIDMPDDYVGHLKITDDQKVVVFDEDITNEDGTLSIQVNDLKYINRNFILKFTNSNEYLDTIYNVKDKTSIVNTDNLKPLHNEAIMVSIDCDKKVNFDIDVILDNVVFINEQNIEVHGLELIPIDRIEMFALYDFPYNQRVSGWFKVYEKEYDENTSVVYDMITTHFYTKKFYVEVYFKGLDLPYKVGFPAYKDAEKQSMYHINEHIDEWGKYFGLKRRDYKTSIPDKDYPFTYPKFYPFDIEQDYWYYQRLINEYAWNDLAINEVDLIDTEGNPMVRLHSIDPFVQDFVVYANSRYPKERENIDYSLFNVTNVDYKHLEAEYKRAGFADLQNLLHYDDNKAYVILGNKKGLHISSEAYKSKPLKTNFDLTYLPEDIDIEDIVVLVEGEATDNNVDKFSNEETGIIIHGIDEDKVFKMNPSDIYGMEEKTIEYHLSDSIKDIKKSIHQYDANIVHKAIIKPFTAKQGTYVNIPFVLKENGEIVDDITEVYVTYDGIKTYQAEYYSDENGRYIRVWLPISTINYTTMSISCKSNKYNSFSIGNIAIENVVQEEEISGDIKNVHYISAPIIDGKQKTLYSEDEWHTGDLRNILQKDSISFVNTIENSNETNTPTIFIKNVQLKIKHKEKKSSFKLQTRINTQNIQAPNIGQLLVTITNTGTTQLLTKIDIVNANNIKLSQNYIDVDLNVGQSDTIAINIIPEYPILDGRYEILTICEDKTCNNSILLSSSGLIQTGVKIDPIYSVYGAPINLVASVVSNDTKINEGKVSFYIDNFKITDCDVIDGKAQKIDNSKIITPGIHVIEARYSGSPRFASSRIASSLIITKNKTEIALDCDPTPVYNKEYSIQARVTSNDSPIKEGAVSFYIDDEFIGKKEVINGKSNFVIQNLQYSPREHTLKAIYEGTYNYAKEETSQIINIIGGETKVTVFKINAKPKDEIILKAFISNVFDIPISTGIVNFSIMEGNNVFKAFDSIPVKKGFAEVPYQIPNNILENYDINEERTFTIVANYVDNDKEIYQSSTNENLLVVKRGDVIIDCNNIFFGSQHEPLGFLIQIKDESTLEPINKGLVKVSIPSLSIESESVEIDNDGYARIICNPLHFTSDEFEQLLNFYFKEGTLLPHSDENNNSINIYTSPNEELESINDENLYRIYDGKIEDLDLMDFDIDANNHLIYRITNKDGTEEDMEQIFIGEDKRLYARTTFDARDIRQYQEGLFSVNINYTPDESYNEKNKNNTIQLRRSVVNIDVHSHKIKYNDKEKNIICYVSEYNLDSEQGNNINDGQVVFFIDNKKIKTSDIVDGKAILSPNDLYSVQHGNHLLTAEYIGNNVPHTYTYAFIDVEPITSVITYNFDKQFKGEKSKLTVTIGIEKSQIPITGDIDLFLDDKLIASQKLLGLEDIQGNISNDVYNEKHMSISSVDFIIDMPNDIDINRHTLVIKYSGDKHILPQSETLVLHEEPIDIHIKNIYDVYVAQNNTCNIIYELCSKSNNFINEGKLVLANSITQEIKAKGYVKNNKVKLSFYVNELPDTYIYSLKYINSTHYKMKEEAQNIIVQEPKNDVYVMQNAENNVFHVNTIEDALQCISDNGNIHIVDYANIGEDLIINKNVNIIGHNNSELRKDIDDLLSDSNSAIKKYSFSDFNETIYEIVGLTKEHLNKTDFYIDGVDIFFVNDQKLIPIFLLNDDKFYSYEQLLISDILSNVSLTLNGNINIENVHIYSNDFNNANDLIIINNGQLNIDKAIIDTNVSINNQGNLNIHNSALYCNIVGSKKYDLDNNWWGSNHTPKYEINNQIKLDIWTEEEPPVIGEDIQIYAGLVSNDGMPHHLPNLEYNFNANSGDFSSATGFLIGNIARTTYYDGTEEGKVYCTVDQETVSLDIFNYNRKTEIILEPATDIPIGYQIPFHARVQSVADTYYLFDDNLNVMPKENDVNGYMNFYLNDKKIGHVPVKNGFAELPVFLSSKKYRPSTILTLKAEYISDDYYFNSTASKDITLINDQNTCFVSPSSNEDGDGTFGNPFDSIRKAILSNNTTIYLKDGTYLDNNIEINSDVTIKSYNNNCIFENNEQPIFIYKDGILSIEKLTFQNNNNFVISSNIIDTDNNKIINIKQCIFTDHQSNAIIDNKQKTNITYSAIIIKNDTKIFNQVYEGSTLKKCWFGTNTPNDDLNEDIELNNYIVMDFDSSLVKNIDDENQSYVYIGAVTLLKATLLHYYNGEYYLLPTDGVPLPLRIAQFYTTHGTLMPTYDYTYSHKAVAFLNTNTSNNADKIILTTPENQNYLNQPVTLKCYVNDAQGNNIQKGSVRFKFTYNDEDIVLKGSINNGVAKVTHPTPILKGEYTLECSYDKYTHISTFKVSQPQIIVSNFNIQDGDHLYNLHFDLEAKDSLNYDVDQVVSIYIDDVFVKKDKIIKGKLSANLIYDFLSLGKHKLTISTKNISSDYDTFVKIEYFTVNKKDTYIDFPYIGASLGEPINLIVKVYDNNQRPVKNGYISVFYDDEIVYTDNNYRYNLNGRISSIPVVNGIATLYNFNTQEKGQHSLVIHYYGTNTSYNDCIFINNIFNVGLEEVVIESDELTEQLNVDIGKEMKLHFPIKDKYGNSIKRGVVKILLDNSIPMNQVPLSVKDGYVDFVGTLPNNTKAMMHDISITYCDPLNKYSTTTYQTKLNVKKIKTQIIIDTINTPPNTQTNIAYKIESIYGIVNTGVLEAYYNDSLIDSADVSDSANEITLNIPLLSAENMYKIIFKYVSKTQSSYESSEAEVNMTISKIPVTIEPITTEYYPKKDFEYGVHITDINGKNIDFGTVTLYIDNVKITTKDVQLGYVSIPLSLDTVKDYKFLVVYNENNYYQETPYPHTFNVKDIKINDIWLESSTSIPNTTFETKVYFDTPNKVNVSDGFIDIKIDDIKVGNFAIVEEEDKYVQFNVPDLSADEEHILTIDYCGSEIFKNDQFISSFTIIKQDIHMSVPSLDVDEDGNPLLTVSLNDTIDFTTKIEETLDGVLKYSLVVDEDGNEYERPIGINQINKEHDIDFSYQLPPSLNQITNADCKIVVYFIENEQYNGQTLEISLIIEKGEVDLSIDIPNKVEYQSSIRILADTIMNNSTLVKFYLDDKKIGESETKNRNDQNLIEINYMLDSSIKPDTEHTIKAVIEESISYTGKEIEKTFNITKSIPILDVGSINAFVGEKIVLPTNLTNKKGYDINDGTLTFHIDEQEIICAPQEDITYQLSNKYVKEKNITVSYEPTEDSNYESIEQTITIFLKKNNLNIQISNLDPITRGQPINKDIIISSPTHEDVSSVSYEVYLENQLINDITKYIVPISLPTQEYYTLTVKINDNDMFEAEPQDFDLINKNVSSIDVDNKISLEKAMELIADRGTINIKTDIEKVSITNNKHITIIGNNHTFTNCNIENYNFLDISNATFKDSKKSVIYNNAELIVQKCTFKSNSAQYGAAIYIDNKNINTKISECTFNQNSASIYGGAIFSKTGNDVTIEKSVFANQNCAGYQGSSISVKGYMYLSQNMFYNNNKNGADNDENRAEIQVISGEVTAENNYFDGSKQSIIKVSGKINCDLNYWGYNDINDIEEHNPNIEINSWLISRYEIDYTEEQLGNIRQKITTKIDQYKNRLENENSLYKDVIGNVPITITEDGNDDEIEDENDKQPTLNETIDKPNKHLQIIIGQEIFNIGG